jgi:hypothetical protein
MKKCGVILPLFAPKGMLVRLLLNVSSGNFG